MKVTKWNSIVNIPKKLDVSKKTFSDAFLANMRPLDNSNVAKVYVVKWSLNCELV